VPTPALDILPNTITLITGTSGSGKSTLLRQIEHAIKNTSSPCHPVTPSPCHVTNLWNIPLPRDRSMVDCFSLPLRETLSVLARAGLAEAPLFLLPPACLSEGQQFRYRLAKWFATHHASLRTHHLSLLLADEFCSMLDRPTAKALAWQLGTFVRATPNTAAILATAHEDLIDDLQPDRLIRKELGS